MTSPRERGGKRLRQSQRAAGDERMLEALPPPACSGNWGPEVPPAQVGREAMRRGVQVSGFCSKEGRVASGRLCQGLSDLRSQEKADTPRTARLGHTQFPAASCGFSP